MNLTPDQMRALAAGEPVEVVIDHTDCVLVRKDVFQRVSSLAYDDSEWTESEMRAMAARAMDEGDSSGQIE